MSFPASGWLDPAATCCVVAEGPGAFPVTEIFLQAGKDLLQLTRSSGARTRLPGSSTPGGAVPSSWPRRGRPAHQESQRNLPDLLHGHVGRRAPASHAVRLGVPFSPRLLSRRRCNRIRSLSRHRSRRAHERHHLHHGAGPVHLGAPPAHPEPTGYDDDQIFAIRPDGTGLRQLTDAAGFTSKADGSIRVELPGPFAYPAAPADAASSGCRARRRTRSERGCASSLADPPEMARDPGRGLVAIRSTRFRVSNLLPGCLGDDASPGPVGPRGGPTKPADPRDLVRAALRACEEWRRCCGGRHENRRGSGHFRGMRHMLHSGPLPSRSRNARGHEG